APRITSKPRDSSWARRANARSRTAGTSTRTRWAVRDSTTSPRSGGGRSEMAGTFYGGSKMQLGKLGFQKTAIVGGIALLALAVRSLPGEAGVKPGDFITPAN